MSVSSFYGLYIPESVPETEAVLNLGCEGEWTCDSCGKRNHNSQLACGVGDWDGCGAAKPESERLFLELLIDCLEE
jgi:hypothetical protein